MTFFQTLPTSAQIVAVLLLVLLVAFITLFLRPSMAQHLKLRRLNRTLAAADKQDIKTLSTLFENDDTLAHLWREYRDTLHPQKELNIQTASYDVVRYRSTIPAEAIFSREALVDSQLRTEFFKHLPGIFTGIGIIGTFWGLTKGLYAFHISEKSEEVRTSLESLLQGVREAFYISLTAIVLAMVCTAVEKWLVSGLYKRVEELCQRIDSMFDTGAGEEYLARLVRSSESSEKETKILKDALVTELKQILEGLTERQIQQASIQAEMIANRIVNGLNDGLKEPLTKIGNAVETVGGNQGDAVNRLLTDTMSALTAQMKDLFGDQISGINLLQQETIAALQGSLSRLDTLAEKMTASGQTATEQMAKQMSDVIAGMDARQKVINAELMKAVSSIRADASDSQTETNRKMQEAVANLGARVTEMVQALQSQVDQASVRDQSRTEALTQHAQHTQAAMTASLDKTLTQVADVGESIKQARGPHGAGYDGCGCAHERRREYVVYRIIGFRQGRGEDFRNLEQSHRANRPVVCGEQCRHRDRQRTFRRNVRIQSRSRRSCAFGFGTQSNRAVGQDGGESYVRRVSSYQGCDPEAGRGTTRS